MFRGITLLDPDVIRTQPAALVVPPLIMRAFNNIWRARDCAIDGYPVQGIILLRAALEDQAAATWIQRYPENEDLWLASMFSDVPQPLDRRGKPRRFPSIDAMLSELNDDDLRGIYSALSKVAHPRSAALSWQIEVSSAGNPGIRIGPRVDQEDLRRVLAFVIWIEVIGFDLLQRLQDEWLPNGIDAVWQDQLKPLVDDGIALLSSVLKELDLTAGP